MSEHNKSPVRTMAWRKRPCTKYHRHDKIHDNHGIKYPEKRTKQSQIKSIQKMFDAQRDPRTQRACIALWTNSYIYPAMETSPHQQ